MDDRLNAKLVQPGGAIIRLPPDSREVPSRNLLSHRLTRRKRYVGDIEGRQIGFKEPIVRERIPLAFGLFSHSYGLVDRLTPDNRRRAGF